MAREKEAFTRVHVPIIAIKPKQTRKAKKTKLRPVKRFPIQELGAKGVMWTLRGMLGFAVQSF